MGDASIVLLTALVADALFGDPVYRFHPVRLIGRAFSLGERAARAIGLDGIIGGAAVLASVLALGNAGAVLSFLAARSAAHEVALAVSAWVIWSCVAARDMVAHARAVARPLASSDVHAARQAVQMIVGRDAQLLDAHGVARAAIESVAESFVDGFLAPVFWFVTGAAAGSAAGVSPVVAGTSCALIYRIANTADSMFGYRSERYLRFGCVPARFDDVLNYLPARLSIVCLMLGAVVARCDSGAGRRTFLRDRLKHCSPNSAHAEAFFAGALGLRLGGPTAYPYGVVDKPWLGTGRAEAGAGDVASAVRLFVASAAVAACGAILTLVFLP